MDNLNIKGAPIISILLFRAPATTCDNWVGNVLVAVFLNSVAAQYGRNIGVADKFDLDKARQDFFDYVEMLSSSNENM